MNIYMDIMFINKTSPMLLESRKAIFFIFYSDIAYIIAATFSKSFFSMKKSLNCQSCFVGRWTRGSTYIWTCLFTGTDK